jgi:hypothetical protein
MGNPPYSHAEAFIRKHMTLLDAGGHCVQLLRLAFLEGQRRRRGLWKEFPAKTIYVLGKRPSFTGDGRTDATAYAIFLWERGWQGAPELRYGLEGWDE